MGHATAAPYITDIAAPPYGLAQRMFPEHTRLMTAVQYGTTPRQSVAYGMIQSGSAFGLVIPDAEDKAVFCITAEYDKMVQPDYQTAIEQALHNVAHAAHLRLDSEGVRTAMMLMRLNVQPSRAWSM
jgi:hypothetical protein